MKIGLQWTLAAPLDWVWGDSADWGSLPFKPEPDGTEILDDMPGWIYTISIQGKRLVGDSYAIIDNVPVDGCTAYCWNDDPEDYTPDQFYGYAIEFLPYQPYFKAYTTTNSGIDFLDLPPGHPHGGCYQPHQTITEYAAPERYTFRAPKYDFTRMRAGAVHRSASPPAILRPWSELVLLPTSLIRYGKWLTDEQSVAHVKAHRQESWREWTEGVPLTELDADGRVKPPSKR